MAKNIILTLDTDVQRYRKLFKHWKDYGASHNHCRNRNDFRFKLHQAVLKTNFLFIKEFPDEALEIFLKQITPIELDFFRHQTTPCICDSLEYSSSTAQCEPKNVKPFKAPTITLSAFHETKIIIFTNHFPIVFDY